MPERTHRSPAWYLDPDDPTSVRHWDGRGWSGSRHRPAWSMTTGELVVDTEGRLDPSKPGSGPVLEGPVRQAPERATTGALNVGGEIRRARQPSALRPPAAVTGARAGQFPPVGVGGAFAGRPPWGSSRRPATAIGLIVIIAVMAMVAVVTLSRPHQLDGATVPSSFASKATQACAVLGTRPTGLPTTALAIGAQDDQLGGVAADLRALANGTGATPVVTEWLDQWEAFIRLEQQRAEVLPPTTPPAGSPSAAVLGQEAVAASGRADRFAAANSLSACSILSTTPAAPAIGAVPS